MITPDVILKSKRKTLSLCVMKDGKVVVRAPSRANQTDIDRFIAEKQNWLATKIALIMNNRTTFEDVIHYQKFLYLGQRYTLKSANVSKIQIDDNFNILIPNKLDNAKIAKALKSWYKKQAKEILGSRSGEISNKVKLYPNEIKISDSKGRWGACNSKNTISYNWRIIMLPPSVIDYVIVHELCHMIEFNHSRKFWELVLAFLPNAKQQKEEIKKFSFLLDMFK